MKVGDIVYPISLAQPLGKDGVFAELVERQRLDK